MQAPISRVVPRGGAAPSPGAWRWPNVSKKQWGPPGWRWLHTTAINYPRAPTRADAQATFRRVWDFVSNLPCEECRRHATHYVTSNPPNLASSDAFQEWAWRFHNAANARLGKPLVSFEEYRRLYARELCRANPGAGCDRHVK